VVDIPIPPEGMVRDEMEAWIVDQIVRKSEVTKLPAAADLRAAKKIIVVKNGKVVNFVL
jgi:leucyl-tRNA synthetase